MNNPDHISKRLERIFRVKILKFFDADPGGKKFGFEMGKIPIGDLGMEKIGSGINIPDPQHWFILELSSFKLNQRVL